MRWLPVSLLIAACAIPGIAQEFEVASVKVSTAADNSSHTHTDRDKLTAENVSLRRLILMAYGLKDYQLEGPDWLAAQRYDIAAKFPADFPQYRDIRDQAKYEAGFEAVMQKLLADRFKLAVHRSQKVMPAYGLVEAKGGIKIKQRPDSGSHDSTSKGTHYQGTCVTMPQFAAFLAGQVDLPVLDTIGPTGCYDFTLDWVPEPKSPTDGRGEAVADAPMGPTLMLAIQEQLGLKLDPRKAPIDIVVVDHAEKVPTEN
jgi:uncharacterized protein (TIGR03435 family)